MPLTLPVLPGRDRWIGAGCVLVGCALLGSLLLVWVGGLDLLAYPATLWRDHPFDYQNIRFTLDSLSPSARLWAYDPLHLYGWTPNTYYNPLATLLGSVWVGIGGGSEGAYRSFLLFLLVATALAFLPLLPRRASRAAWIAGGLCAGGLTFLIYPMDVGILDANPVQILYTGQWAQRLGVALGLLALERFSRSLQLLGEDPRRALARALTAAMLAGAALFSHYMSGVATAAGIAALALHHLLFCRWVAKRWAWATLGLPPLVGVAMLWLFADFFFAYLAPGAAYHGLPLLEWELPQGALETVREVLTAGLPFLLIPLAGLRGLGPSERGPLARALWPLAVFAVISLTTPAWTGLGFLVLFAGSLWVAALEKQATARCWLPMVGSLLLWLSCGPDSLRPFGLDLPGVLPLTAALGWAKFAAFARFLFFAWFGVLVVEGLAQAGRPLARAWTAACALLGIVLPLLLGQGGSPRQGAQVFLGWMSQTDRPATAALLARMREVAARTPPDGILLIEDTLHHPEGSALSAPGVPFGHLPYLVGPAAKHPTLGGAVTTRWITHPLSQTGQAQLLCQDLAEIAREPAPIFDRLRARAVSDLLVHSPPLVEALRQTPFARERSVREGLFHFTLESYQPVLTDGQGSPIAAAQVAWDTDRLRLTLPAGASAEIRLRQVFHPFLRCRASGPTGARPCALSAWTEGPERFSSCRAERPRSFEVEIPWLAIRLAPDPGGGPVALEIASAPPLWPLGLMGLGWILAIGWRFWPFGARARRRRAPITGEEDGLAGHPGHR